MSSSWKHKNIIKFHSSLFADLEIDLVRGHIATLRGMHEKEIIHMDLEGKHIGFIIIADGTKVSHIIDMSSALPANEQVQCQLVSGM